MSLEIQNQLEVKEKKLYWFIIYLAKIGKMHVGKSRACFATTGS